MTLLVKRGASAAVCIIAILLMAGIVIQPARATAPPVAEAAYDGFMNFFYEARDSAQSYEDQAAATLERYNVIFTTFHSNDGIERLPARDLYFLQLASELVLSLTFDETVFGHARALFTELQNREELSRASYVAYYRSLVFSKDFESAESIRETVGAAAIPWNVVGSSRISPGSRSVLVRDTSKEQLTVRSHAGYKNGVYIVGHPYCVWTQRALTDLEKALNIFDKEVAKVHLISPFQTIFQSDYEWPAGHPDFEIVIDESNWPEISSWELPTFVFIGDGEVLLSFSGWPSSSRLELFQEGLRRLDRATTSTQSNGSSPNSGEGGSDLEG